ncbi:DUF1439 domain-containing protein [Dechloromonas sp. A34]|uniref:DUF1439 domain-containing protein n=1 Tax=Dechloromonas sp. A34 TaxID=447588 RepID=UPI0022492AF9|nr:DUF1439 domain-containing protein [Dechloromonas sp. A34]
MKPSITALLFAALAAIAPCSQAELLGKEVAFSETEIQTALARSGPQQRNYNGLMTVALLEVPRITLGVPEGRVGIVARVHISLLGQPAIPVDVTGTAGIRYNDNTKAFYLENPVADSVSSQALPKEYEPAARNAVNTLVVSYFRKPVYVLRADASPEEATARWLLRSVRIEPGRVVAVLSPL